MLNKIIPNKLREGFTKHKRTFLVLVFVVVGVTAIILTNASSSNLSIQPEDGTRSPNAKSRSSSDASGGGYIEFTAPSQNECGNYVQNYDYDVPFGNAVWNQPVCNLQRHSRSNDYASRFYNWSFLRTTTDPQITVDNFFRFNMSHDDPAGTFSQPVYYASEATTSKKVVTSSNRPSNLDGEKSIYSSDWDRKKVQPDTEIPWNNSWGAGNNDDAQMIILDEEEGIIYELSGVQPFCIISNKICVGTAHIGRDEITTEIIDYRTYEGPLTRRGVGLSWLAGLVTADEILAGEIRHAISVAIPNTAKGPECTNAQKGTSAEGVSCGVAVAPATKFEHLDPTAGFHPPSQPAYSAIYGHNKLIPEGMRFALDITDAEIEDWINNNQRLDGNPRLTETARIIARALKDYGFMIVDTAGNPSVQTTGALNKAESDRWKSLGLDDSSKAKNLMWGLIKQEDLYVVEPPTVTCEDGSQSKYYCTWSSASY